MDPRELPVRCLCVAAVRLHHEGTEPQLDGVLGEHLHGLRHGHVKVRDDDVEPAVSVQVADEVVGDRAVRADHLVRLFREAAVLEREEERTVDLAALLFAERVVEAVIERRPQAAITALLGFIRKGRFPTAQLLPANDIRRDMAG